MERILTIEQMRREEAHTISDLGIPNSVLIERAGLALTDEIRKRFKGGRVLICVGRGNNGEDGRVLFKALSAIHGFTVALFNAEVAFYKVFEKKFDIIVDCLFGTGLNREITGRYKTAIEKINQSKAYKIACDIPSGINGDTGKVMGVAVKADLTVAIQEYKRGLFLDKGIEYAGEVVAKDIGISVWTDNCVNKITDKDAASLFPERPKNSHKGSFPKIAVVGGSKSYSGSVILSKNALAAYKTGAGYSEIFVPNCLFNAVCGVDPECILTAVKDDGKSIAFDQAVLEKLMKNDAVAFGMGAGVTDGVYKSLCFLIENYKGRLLIDADGLNSLAAYGKEVLENKSCEIVLTPHIGEFARLSGVDKAAVSEDPIGAAEKFALKYGVTVLLKSAVSVITDGKNTVLNVTGNAGMAKGGSGDALAGFTAGLLARKEEPWFCAAVGAYLLGKAGDIAAKEQNDYTITASDTIRALPQAINAVLKE